MCAFVCVSLSVCVIVSLWYGDIIGAITLVILNQQKRNNNFVPTFRPGYEIIGADRVAFV